MTTSYSEGAVARAAQVNSEMAVAMAGAGSVLKVLAMLSWPHNQQRRQCTL